MTNLSIKVGVITDQTGALSFMGTANANVARMVIDELNTGSARFTAGSACSGMYRGLKLWEAAVKEAGSLNQDDVIEALDHARIAEGPGGPAEMAPGRHHVRMNMYIARARDGRFRIVESLGCIEPKECLQGLC